MLHLPLVSVYLAGWRWLAVCLSVPVPLPACLPVSLVHASMVETSTIAETVRQLVQGTRCKLVTTTCVTTERQPDARQLSVKHLFWF